MRSILLAILPALAAAAPADGLVGHWKFDESRRAIARSAVGDAAGELKGPRWVEGVAGAALHFEVSRDQVEIPARPEFDLTEELTIAVWLKTENFDTPIVNKLEYWAPGNYDFRLEKSGALGLAHEAGPGQPWSRYASTARLAVSRWHHAAVTLKRGGEVRFYVDGAPAGTSPQVGDLLVFPAQPLRIGAKPDPYSSFRGVLDELRLYRRALGPDEVRALADEFQPPRAATAPADESPPVATITRTVVTADVAPPDPAAEWAQWRGPRRDGKSAETGLLRCWPEGGPRLAWFAEGLGEGYSSVAVSGGRLYTTGMIARQELLFCFDLAGNVLWQRVYGPAWTGRYPEARSTPTVDSGNAYVVSGLGLVACFDAATGEPRWSRDAAKEFGTNYHHWGIAESPLIVGDTLVCTPAGSKATFVGLDKRTGRVVWTSESLGEVSGYSSPIFVPRAGRNLVIGMLNQSVAGLDAADGKILWRVRYRDYQSSPHGINPNSPVFADGAFYTSSGYDNGGALHDLSADGATVTRRWADRTLDCHHGGVVLVDGFLYGSNFQGHYSGKWVCLDWATGAVRYEAPWISKGSLTFADGRLYCYEEKSGTIALVVPTPERFEIVSTFQMPRGTGPHWAHPVICGGRLYVRHGTALLAYDVRAPLPSPR